jgi:hypothetical protein
MREHLRSSENFFHPCLGRRDFAAHFAHGFYPDSRILSHIYVAIDEVRLEYMIYCPLTGRNTNDYSTIAISTLCSSPSRTRERAHTLGFSVFTSLILATDFNSLTVTTHSKCHCTTAHMKPSLHTHINFFSTALPILR